MLTALTILTLASLAQPSAPAAQAGPQEQPAAQAPSSRRQEPLATDEIVRVYSLAGLQGQAEDATTPPASVAIGLARVMGLRAEMLNAVTAAIRGSKPQHDAFAQTLEQMRQSSAARYRVDLAAIVVSGPAPRVGAPIESIHVPEVRVDRIIAQRAASPFVAVRTQSYIETWRTIVSTGSAGYEPSLGSAWSGLRAAVTIEDVAQERVLVRLDGSFRRSSVTTTQLPLVPAGGGSTVPGPSASIGLPQVDERTLDSTTRVALGQMTVLTSTTGFEPGTSLIIIARVERAD